jgi:preprotein translocase subunit SecG
MIENLLLIAHLVMAVSLVVLVLLQQGKGAQAGAAFGGGSSGSSQSLFGARGSANFLTRTTATVATIFFCTTLSLAYLYANRSVSSSVVSESVIEQVEIVTESDVPMVPSDAQNEDGIPVPE